MSQTSGSAYQRLVAAAARLKIPEAVREVATAAPRDPEPGQIWRAVWGGTVQMTAVTSVRDDTVLAVPVSVERFHDERTVLLPESASTLEQPLAIWCGLRAAVPWCVLDRQIGQLTTPLPAELKVGSPVGPAGARWGAPASALTTSAAEFRGVLTDAMDELKAARWSPEGSGSLPQLFQQHGLTRQQLANLLSLPPVQVLALWRGQIPITYDQARRLGDFLDVPAAEIIAANPALPAEVVHTLSRPLRRWQLQQLAKRESTTGDTARTKAAFEIFALAARQPGGQQVDWEARTDRYFQIRLGEAGER